MAFKKKYKKYKNWNPDPNRSFTKKIYFESEFTRIYPKLWNKTDQQVIAYYGEDCWR